MHISLKSKSIKFNVWLSGIVKWTAKKKKNKNAKQSFGSKWIGCIRALQISRADVQLNFFRFKIVSSRNWIMRWCNLLWPYFYFVSFHLVFCTSKSNRIKSNRSHWELRKGKRKKKNINRSIGSSFSPLLISFANHFRLTKIKRQNWTEIYPISNWKLTLKENWIRKKTTKKGKTHLHIKCILILNVLLFLPFWFRFEFAFANNWICQRREKKREINANPSKSILFKLSLSLIVSFVSAFQSKNRNKNIKEKWIWFSTLLHYRITRKKKPLSIDLMLFCTIFLLFLLIRPQSFSVFVGDEFLSFYFLFSFAIAS